MGDLGFGFCGQVGMGGRWVNEIEVVLGLLGIERRNEGMDRLIAYMGASMNRWVDG